MNDNDNNNENILDFTKLRAQRGESQSGMNQVDNSKKSSVRSGTFELHLHPKLDGDADEVIKQSGYLKFGPQFIAVVDGPQDESQVLFAVQTHLVRFVKMLSEDESHTQSTLDLG